MKIKTFHLVALVATVLACGSCSNNKFRIEGSITEAKDSTLFLENVGLDGIVKIDSVTLGESGEFAFSLPVNDAPEFYRLRIARQIVNLSVDSTETVSVKATYPTMAYNYEVEGSDDCLKIKELALHQMALQSKINNIIKDPTLKISAVEDSIEGEVDKYKNFVKREYIFKSPEKSYSYFALFQTIVVGYSYNLIFDPRASEDDIKAYAAVATSWDTFHPGSERGENLHNIAIEGMKNVRIIKARQSQTFDADKINTSGVVDITLADNKGNIRKLSDLKGKVVILDFCSFAQDGTTRRIMSMRDVYNKYHDAGLEIFQVSLDTNEHFWKTQTSALPWISVNDPDGAGSVYALRYNIQTLPTFFLLNKDCTPYKRDVQITDLDAEIRSLL